MNVKGRLATIALSALILALSALACSDDDDDTDETPLYLGASTTVQDPGLLDELIAAFEEDYDYEVRAFRQSSGHLLELARNGELDVVMTHAPEEESFLTEVGYASERTAVTQNFFQLVDPRSDPADVASATTMGEAFARIAESGSPFISRGDDSGVYQGEVEYWRAAGVNPLNASWYEEAHLGQREVLALANEKNAYTLSDSSTFITLEDDLNIVLLYRDESDPNEYSVLRLNHERLEDVNPEGAGAWIEFVTSETGQRIIDNYGREEFGESLFAALLLD